jgi:hypothetical protein
VGNMPAPPEAPTLDPARALDRALSRAREALQGVAANDSLCTLQGERVQAAKYWEGQVVALRELQRAGHGVHSPEGRSGGHAALISQWSEQLRAHERSDLKWRSYLTGGLDALNTVS